MPFTILVTLLGVTQGIGKASTIKYVPVYYPKDVGAVVGLVGALRAAGGSRKCRDVRVAKGTTGLPQSMFWVDLRRDPRISLQIALEWPAFGGAVAAPIWLQAAR